MADKSRSYYLRRVRALRHRSTSRAKKIDLKLIRGDG